MARVLRIVSIAGAVVALAFAEGARAEDPGIAATLSWERMFLPALTFGGKYDYTALDGALVSELKHGEGELDGARIDFAYRFRTAIFGETRQIAGIRAFFSAIQEQAKTVCQSQSDLAACDSVSLIDPSANDVNVQGFGIGDMARYEIDRDVKHWGEALEIALFSYGAITLRTGIGHRAITQDLSLASNHEIMDLSQSYREMLDTHYLGAFVGLAGRAILAPGLTLSTDLEVGHYRAQTDYDGRLSREDLSATTVQHLSLDRNEDALIASLMARLEQRLGQGLLHGFVRGEYYSYVPEMAYNQADRAGGFPTPFALNGRDGTHIDEEAAWTLSAGVGYSVPFNFSE